MAIVLLTALCLGLVPAAAAGSETAFVRVGLAYGADVLTAANLENAVGEGYRLGYWNDDGSFTALAQTGETQITMLRDQTLYLSGGRYYDAKTAAAYETLGAYHLELDCAFSGYDAALTEAARLPGGFAAWQDGAYTVRFGSYAKYDEAKAAAEDYGSVTLAGGGEAGVLPKTTSQYGVTVTVTGTTEILFEYDGGAGSALGVEPIAAAEEKAATWFKGSQYYGGFRYQRLGGGDLTVVNLVELEDYVACVVCREMYVNWPIETLKAGACAARTFALAAGKHLDAGFDVCGTTCCQVYGGVYLGGDWTRAREAAQATAGESIRYEGKLIQALYYSSNGGAIEDAENAWGTDVAYLTAKYDPFESMSDTSNTYWAYSFTRAQLTALLRARGVDCGSIADVAVTKYTAIGNAQELVFTDTAGKTYVYQGDRVRVFENSTDGYYTSRKFTVIAPHQEGTFLQVTAKDTDESAQTAQQSGVFVQTAAETQTAADGAYYVYDGVSLTKTDTLMVLTPAGLTSVAETGAATTAGTQTTAEEEPEHTQAAPTGLPEAELTEVTVKNDSDSYLVVGSGWGHNIGMSQYGAKAMAELGYTYDQILQYYYTDVTVG